MIFAVIVTYNRLAFLQNLITELQNQTFALDRIIVVNNNSTDGTTEWLSKQNYLNVIFQENIGGSGGFNTGVKYAFENNADWIWLMDDDVLPRRNCLENLIYYRHFSKCLHPIHLDHNGEILEEEKWFDTQRCNINNLENISFKNGKNIWFRNIGSFEGMLIAKEIVAKIGYPDKRFFLVHDDLIYGYLAHRYTNVAVIANAIMDKQEVKKSIKSKYTYLFYYYRNFWILNEYLNIESSRLKGFRKRRITFIFLYGIYKIIRMSEFNNKPKALQMLFKAFMDYRNKKTGKLV